MRIAWLSDAGLNSLSGTVVNRMRSQLLNGNYAHVIMTGNIISGLYDVGYYYRDIMPANMNVSFVLGSTEVLGSATLTAYKTQAAASFASSSHINYLSRSNPINLGEGAFLVGSDGWFDSPTQEDFDALYSYHADQSHLTSIQGMLSGIYDLYSRSTTQIAAYNHDRRDSELSNLHLKIREAKHRGARRIIVATHFPAFEALLTPQSGNGVPLQLRKFYLNSTLGVYMRSEAQVNPGIKYLLLSGHTKINNAVQILPNLRAMTARPLGKIPGVMGDKTPLVHTIIT